MTTKKYALLMLALIGVAGLSGCAGAPASPGGDGRLNVIATTTIVGDVVRQVGGDTIALTVLLPVGTDPHAFDPSPQDMVQNKRSPGEIQKSRANITNSRSARCVWQAIIAVH